MAMSDGLKEMYLDRFLTLMSWAMLIVILLSAIALGANRPVSWSLLAIFTSLIFVGHLGFDLWKGMADGATRIMSVAVLFLAVLVWAYVQTLPGLPQTLHHPLWEGVSSPRAAISADPIQGHHTLMRLICYAMAFWVGMRVATDAFRAYTMIKVIAWFSTALAAFGLYAFFIGENAVVGDAATNRVVVATFVNRNSYATYALIGLMANLVCYMTYLENDLYGNSRSRLRNFLETFFAGSWIYAVGVLLCLSGIVLSLSRAGVGAAGIGILGFFIAYAARGRASNPLMLVSVLAIFGFVALTLTSGITERFLATSDENLRFQIYPLILDGIQDRWLLGHGLGAFLDVFRADVPAIAANGEWDYAHNTYLENVFELGIPAAALFYLALALVALRIWNGTRVRQRDRLFSCMGVGLLLAVSFHAMFDFTLQMPATAALFAFILGISWTQSFSGRSGRKSR